MKKILIVEDEVLIAIDMKSFFTEQGYEVHTAHNYADALELWSQHSGEIDAILLDYKLPGEETGMDFLDHVRKTDPNVFVAVVTGWTEPRHMMNGRRLEGTFFAYFEKPADYSQILTCISRRPPWNGVPVSHRHAAHG